MYQTFNLNTYKEKKLTEWVSEKEIQHSVPFQELECLQTVFELPSNTVGSVGRAGLQHLHTAISSLLLVLCQWPTGSPSSSSPGCPARAAGCANSSLCILSGNKGSSVKPEQNGEEQNRIKSKYSNIHMLLYNPLLLPATNLRVERMKIIFFVSFSQGIYLL